MDWTGARVLLTGGTGSFGHAFASFLLERHAPSRLRIFSRDEWKQQQMAEEACGRHPAVEFWIGDVRDAERLEEAGAGCDVWVHAAALKQISACEANPLEAFKTNLLGTANLLRAAERLRPELVVCLSTDKAVAPANAYGASKMGAEKLAVSAAARLAPGTRVCVVRYGNVLGSRGSVIPRLRERCSDGAVALTDPRATRFWIPQRRAAEFVLRSASVAQGGEILIPRMRSFRLAELAGLLTPGAPIRATGLLPGEKLHETLLSEHESPRALALEDLYVLLPAAPDAAARARYPQARPLPENFRYASDTNADWWDADEIRPLLAGADSLLP